MRPVSLKTYARRIACVFALAAALTACSASTKLKTAAEDPHVVLVSISAQTPGVCSATLIAGTTTALTAAHCLEGATAVTIEHAGAALAAREALVAPDADLALLVFATAFEEGHTLAPSQTSPIDASAIGWDKGTDLVACKLDQIAAQGVFRFPCGMLPGASGGPVLTDTGIVGVISTLGSDGQNSATALDALTKVGTWARVPLG